MKEKDLPNFPSSRQLFKMAAEDPKAAAAAMREMAEDLEKKAKQMRKAADDLESLADELGEDGGMGSGGGIGDRVEVRAIPSNGAIVSDGG